MRLNHDVTARFLPDTRGTGTLTFQCETKYDSITTINIRLTYDQLYLLVSNLYTFIAKSQYDLTTNFNGRFALEIFMQDGQAVVTVIQAYSEFTFIVDLDDLSELADHLNHELNRMRNDNSE